VKGNEGGFSEMWNIDLNHQRDLVNFSGKTETIKNAMCR
jgi:hypothetical protein